MNTPMECNQKQTTMEYYEHVGELGDVKLDDPGPCQRLIGKLLYLSMTIPDITYAMLMLS